MATSESEDFESADEEMGHHVNPMRRNMQKQRYTRTIGSDTDDDTDYISQTVNTNPIYSDRVEKQRRPRPPARIRNEADVSDKTDKQNAAAVDAPEKSKTCPTDSHEGKCDNSMQEMVISSNPDNESLSTRTQDTPRPPEQNIVISKPSASEGCSNSAADRTTSGSTVKSKERVRQQRRPHEQQRLGARKLGTKLPKSIEGVTDGKSDEDKTVDKGENVHDILTQASHKNTEIDPLAKSVTSEDKDLTSGGDDWADMDLPEELKSDKKFKEVFKPDGWEGLGDEIELPDELTEEKLQPVMERLASAGQESQNSASTWSRWGSWGVSSLINTATASVTTLTSHVSHGLTLLEETIGAPEPFELAKSEEEEGEEEAKSYIEKSSSNSEMSPSQSSFGFSNFISGVSSITKLVESTSSKVVSGGLDTLEAIGKKTMEVLQEGDPGLKKKRAFLTIETDKPILSKILREAKEKAEAEEKTLEEKQLARKVHFESLFDDYQGLVHLEALEMLSKQSNLKIQQYLINLDTDELTSAQETLDEVKELCDLGDDDNDDDNDGGEKKEKDLKIKLQEACKDLNVNISYDKVCNIWEEAKVYVSSASTQNHREVFQQAISMLAQFTAVSVERFHKTAELLLIKERRSTVNEADALVQLTRILSGHISTIANLFCDSLNETSKSSDKPDDINANITTVFLEAANASSYIQDAFRLLIPILQVGAI